VFLSGDPERPSHLAGRYGEARLLSWLPVGWRTALAGPCL